MVLVASLLVGAIAAAPVADPLARAMELSQKGDMEEAEQLFKLVISSDNPIPGAFVNYLVFLKIFKKAPTQELLEVIAKGLEKVLRSSRGSRFHEDAHLLARGPPASPPPSNVLVACSLKLSFCFYSVSSSRAHISVLFADPDNNYSHSFTRKRNPRNGSTFPK